MVALVRSYSLVLISNFLWCSRNTHSLYFGGQLVCIIYSAVHNDLWDVRQALLLPRYKQRKSKSMWIRSKITCKGHLPKLHAQSWFTFKLPIFKTPKKISFPKTLSLSSPDLEKAFSHGYLKPIHKLQRNDTNLISGNTGWIWPPSDKTDSKVPVFIFMSP